MIRKCLYQVHWLLGITLGLILVVIAITGTLMTFEDPVMEALSHKVLEVAPREAPRLGPEALLARFRAQMPGAKPVALALKPAEGATARILYRMPSETQKRHIYLDPYDGRILGDETGQAFFDGVLAVHRYLFFSGDAAKTVGRNIAGVAGFCLIFFVLSGLYLRWPRNAADWRAWLVPDLRRRGRSLYWSLHSVAGTWLLPIYLIIGLTGLTWVYDWYRDLATDLLAGAAPAQTVAAAGEQKLSFDFAWNAFTTAVPDFSVSSMALPEKSAASVTFRYLDPHPPNDQAFNEITIDGRTGAVISHQRYADAPLGKRILIALLAVHRGAFFGGWATSLLFCLAGLTLPLFPVTGYLLYLDRRAKKKVAKALAKAVPAVGAPAGGEAILIAFASQSGTAERIAWQSASALIEGGQPARVASLGTLTAEDLRKARTLLLVASTFGSGEPPDAARPFARRVMAGRADLSGLRYGLVALGDRTYENFCGFGRSLDRWLRDNGAVALFPRLEANGKDFSVVAVWESHLRRLGAAALGGVFPSEGDYQPWWLVERRLLNPGSSGGEAWHLSLEPRDPAHLAWIAGDIAEVLIPSAGLSRHYSIASLPASGRLELLVRKAILPDGGLGLGSGWLTQKAEIGAEMPLRIRSNPHFHPPEPELPTILIGAGTGLAGLRAHLQHRKSLNARKAWLIFGERSGETDRLHGDEIEAWRADGTLDRCDMTFSRDAARPLYVQHRIAELASDIRQWIVENKASILICGGLSMAAGVDEALGSAIGADYLDRMMASGRYRRDVY